MRAAAYHAHHVGEITGPKYAGVSVGYLQLLGNVAAMILVPTMEGLNSATGQFTLPLVMLVVLLLISFTMAFWIRDTHPVRVTA